MADYNDDSGQVLLTSTILFVVIIIFIALMLNSIIYATNVAYLGFMDGSKYEDLSIRKLTTGEAHGSYQTYPSRFDDSIALPNPRLINRTKYMDDYESAINYLTNSKGKYVELVDTYYTSPHSGLITTQTKWDMVITDKNSKTNYSIQTGSWNPTAPRPPPSMPMPSVRFSNASYDVSEGGAVTVTVNLSNIYDQTVIVNYDTQNGTATAPVDYISSSGYLTFTSGELEKTLTIFTVQDSVYEVPETFTVNLVGFTNPDGSPVSAAINIADDDPAPETPETQEDWAMKVSCTAVRQASGNQKDVTITAVVENTGINSLTNINLTLISPTGKSFSSGVNPAPLLGTLNHSSTYTYTWVIVTQNQNDLVNVKVKATANEIPDGVSSGTQMGI